MNSRMSLKSLLTFTLALLMVVGCVAGLTSIKASAAAQSETINFATTAQRTKQDSNQQVWISGNVTFTNDKASSSNPVANYSNPVRLYQGSKVTISATGGITEIKITSDGTSKYKTALQDSLKGAGYTYTNSGNDYTITLDGASKSVSFSLTAQARFKSLTVTYEAGCQHSNTSDVVIQEPTCTDPGSKNVVCNDCQKTIEENAVIPATGHSDEDNNLICDDCQVDLCEHKTQTSGVGAKAATCTQPGYTGDTVCDDCNTTIVKGKEISATGHAYSDWDETIAPGCTTAGEQKQVCSVCGDVKTEAIKATDHKYEDGVCTVCGEEQPLEATLTFDADKANRTEYTTSKQVWMQNGITVTNDNGNVGDYANPVRFYKNTTVTIEAAGMTTIIFDCSYPDDTKYYTALKDSLTNAGYTFTEVGKVLTVTFTDPVDSISFTCAAQARVNSITVAFAAAGGCEHEWGDWETVTNATIFEKGTQERHCVLCDDVQTQDIPAIADVDLTIPQANELGGSKASNSYTEGKYYVTGVIVEINNTTYGNVYIEDAEGNRFYVYGLYSEDGSVRYDAMEVQPAVGDTITVYGQIGSYNSTPQMYHGWVVAHTIPVAPVMPEASITETVLNLGADLAMKYMVDANEAAFEAGMTLEVTFEGKTVVLNAVQVSEGKYMFVFDDIAPQMINQNIAVVFKVGGEEVQTKAEDSVKAYLLELVGDATYGELVKAVLAYGDAALKYVKENVSDEELSNVEVEMYKPLESDKAVVENNTLTTHGIVSANVEFNTTVKLVFTVYLGTTEGVTVNLNGVACKVTPVEGKDGYYTVSTEGLSADRLNEQFTLTIVGAGDVVPTLVYSVNSYAYSMSTHSDAKMAELAAALYHYSKCVENL